MGIKLRKKELVSIFENVNGEYFDVYFSAEDAGLERKHSLKLLKHVYENPSELKRQIWNHWEDWFYFTSENLREDYICINSYNTHFFTIRGSITYNKIQYYFYISPSKRVLFLV